MIPRVFKSVIVNTNERTIDVLKKLSDTHVGYRTEGMVPTKLYNGSETIEIYYSYVENFSFSDHDTDEPEDIEENLYQLYEVGVEPNHVK